MKRLKLLLSLLIFFTANGCSQNTTTKATETSSDECPLQPTATLNLSNVKLISLDKGAILESGTVSSNEQIGYTFTAKSGQKLLYKTENELCFWLYTPENQLINTTKLPIKLQQTGRYILQVSVLKGSKSFQLSLDLETKYTQLENYLAANKWKEADYETLQVMLDISGRKSQNWLDIKSIKNYPCLDLHILDKLWTEYSNRKFGFKLQKHIYVETGNKFDKFSLKTYEKFGERVGWRKSSSSTLNEKTWKSYDEMEFTLNAPKGHLPMAIGLGSKEFWALDFFSRLQACNL